MKQFRLAQRIMQIDPCELHNLFIMHQITLMLDNKTNPFEQIVYDFSPSIFGNHFEFG